MYHPCVKVGERKRWEKWNGNATGDGWVETCNLTSVEDKAASPGMSTVYVQLERSGKWFSSRASFLENNSSHPMQKMNSSWIKDLNSKSETMRHGRTLAYTTISIRSPPKYRQQRQNKANEMISNPKQSVEWKNILQNGKKKSVGYLSDNVLMSRIYEQL